MKKVLFLFSVALSAGMYSSQSLGYAYSDCLGRCAVTIKVDGTNSSKTCDDTPTYCSCSAQGGYGPVGSCRFSTDYVIGPIASGGLCCGTARSAQTTDNEEVQSSSTQNLGDVFSERTESYYGLVNASSRSPNAGRAQSIDARLDACLGYGVVDTYVTSYTGCISACNDSTKNGYCTASVTNNGASDTNGVCHDRCECKYGMGGTCDNL